MKQFSFLFLFLSLYFAQAQTVCESFEGLSVPTQDRQHAFNIYGNGNPGFLSKWYVTNGTPAIYASGQINGINAYKGSQYALLAVCKDTNVSEGFSVRQDFLQGKTYTVSMAIRNRGSLGTPVPINIQFVLLDSVIPYSYQTAAGCSKVPAIPGNAKVAYTLNNFSNGNWNLLKFNVTNLPANYRHMWIRATFPSGSSTETTYLLMDTFCIKEWVPNGCYNFEEYFVPLNETGHAFELYGNGKTGFLQDWHVASGTPSIYSTGQLSGVFAYKGDQYALLTVCGQSGNYNEGVSLKHNFEQGKSYTVSMAIRNRNANGAPTPIDVDFLLLKDSINFAYQTQTGCTQMPAAPAGADTVHSLQSFAQDSWQLINFDINNLSSSFKELWFRTKFSSGATLSSTNFLFDSVCVKEKLTPNAINDSYESRAIQLYPNPAQNLLHVETAQHNGVYQIYDMTGKEVMNGKASSSNFIIDISSLSKGVFFFMFTEGGVSSTHKVVKQ